MCKIAILTQHDPAKLAQIVTNVWISMSSSERDGFGAAWMSPSGEIQSIKSSVPEPRDALPEFFEGFSSGAFTPSNGGPLLIHGRTATCGVNVENTHPILAGNCALIHNGIVTSKRFHNIETTCDSELLIHAWNDGGTKALADDISGYYAFALLTVRPRKRWTLDVVRDARAPLVGGTLHNGAVAFATTPAVLAATGAAHKGAIIPNAHIHYRDGRYISTVRFTPKIEVSAATKSASYKAFAGSDWPNADYRSTNWRQERQQWLDGVKMEAQE